MLPMAALLLLLPDVLPGQPAASSSRSALVNSPDVPPPRWIRSLLTQPRRLSGLTHRFLATSVTVELLRYKREHPADDLTTDLLLPSEPNEESMPDPVLLDTLFLMIGAGCETTVNLITSAVQALLTHPGHLTRIREGAISWEDVIEETLRIDAPVMHLPMRYAVEDIDLGEGVVIRKGDPVIIGFAAAGRDPELHPDRPEHFDPTRTSKEHLAFGHGPHFCLGAHLARLEADTALTTLFTHLPDLALAHPGAEPARLQSFIVNGPVGLEIVPHPM
jgi:2-hydroxy-5-methyl-1-naphthoate 7-hydroxylase